jgi:hypothetical protein
MRREYVAVIKGPNEIIPGGVKFERLEITEEEIQEYLEEGEEDETEDDAIKYILEEYIASYEQRLCNVVILSPEEFDKVYNYLGHLIIDEGILEEIFEEEESDDDSWSEWE